MMRNNSKDFINFGCVKVYKKQNERRFAVSLYKAFTVISSDLLSALAVLFLSPSLPDNIFFRVNSHDTQEYLIDENTSCYEAIWIPIFIHRCVKWRCHLKFIITDNATILQDTNINYRRYIDSLSLGVCMDGTECTTVFAIANDGTPLALFTSMLTFHVAWINYVRT